MTIFKRKSGRMYYYERERRCATCSKEFVVTASGGVGGYHKKYCSDECRQGAREARKGPRVLCSTSGCRNAKGYSSGICNSCYYRVRRTGTLEKRELKGRWLSSHGYVQVCDAAHPLARSSGLVYEHRKVLFDAIGEGPHPCHWCGRELRWVRGARGGPTGALVPDHLDGDKANNARANLVPACHPCNASRGLFQSWVLKHSDDPWLWALFERHSKRAA